MGKMDRVAGKRITISDEKTKAFFGERTNKNLPHRYNYVIYQDSNPELALKRDRYEKECMRKYLMLDAKSRVLDIGCGVGRWGDEIAKWFDKKSEDGIYVGVDFSDSLLDVAREQLGEEDHCYFFCGAFQNLRDVLKENRLNVPFNRILINGVLMYINDADIEQCLESVDSYLFQGGIVYIKEPVGVAERLTLNRFYSDELSSEYSAIYRSLQEYTTLLTKYFFEKGYTLVACAPTWPEDLENRKETMNYYWILRKE